MKPRREERTDVLEADALARDVESEPAELLAARLDDQAEAPGHAIGLEARLQRPQSAQGPRVQRQREEHRRGLVAIVRSQRSRELDSRGEAPLAGVLGEAVASGEKGVRREDLRGLRDHSSSASASCSAISFTESPSSFTQRATSSAYRKPSSSALIPRRASGSAGAWLGRGVGGMVLRA